MKTLKSIPLKFALAIAITALIFACDINPNNEVQPEILPESFAVDIPNSISNDAVAGGRFINGRVADDTLNGNEIYEQLGLFIAIGEGASDLVESIIFGIRVHNINRPITLTYISDDDNRAKNLVVIESSEFEGKTYDYELTITDADSEQNVDGGKAMQVFWNTSPVEGIAILKPFNIDRVHDADAGEGIFRIDYSENSEFGYDAHMIVSISNLTLEDPNVDPFSMRTIRMFAGKSGDVVDVYGNSSHPNAKLFTDDTGFNWAFVASGSEESGLGVAEVGLPPSNLDSNDRAVLLEDNSVKSVFTAAINEAFPNFPQWIIDAYLVNTEAPGFFDNDGFIQGGTSPGSEWDELVSRIQDLTPYNPLETSNLEIMFK